MKQFFECQSVWRADSQPESHGVGRRRTRALAIPGLLWLLLWVGWVCLPGRTQAAPVASYGFEEGSGSTTINSSGSGLTGTLDTGVTWTASGKYGAALVFNGASSVSVAPNVLLDLTIGLTIEAWIFPTAATSFGAIIAKEQAGNGWVYSLFLTGTASAFSGIYIAGERTLDGITSLSLNIWSHIAMTYDGATERLFVNGIEVASLAVSGSVAISTLPLRFGGDTVTGEYFTGRIDEVRLYNSALSAAEITTDMNTPIVSTGTIPLPASGAQVTFMAEVALPVRLEWFDNEPIAGFYELERDQVLLQTLAGSPGTGWRQTQDSAANPGVRCYRVRQVDDTGGTLPPSGYSNEMCVYVQ